LTGKSGNKEQQQEEDSMTDGRSVEFEVVDELTEEEREEARERAEQEARDLVEAAVFDPLAPAVAEVIQVLDELQRRWPESDRYQEALISTLEFAASCLHIDAGRSRLRGKSPVWVPSSLVLWRYWRSREEEETD
jgi:hypothetical protein